MSMIVVFLGLLVVVVIIGGIILIVKSRDD